MEDRVEIWEDIPNYENYYQASNLGRIKGLDRVIINSLGRKKTIKGEIIVPVIGKDGYLKLNLGKDIVLRWGSGSLQNSTKDLGIRRISDGLMEIYNGVTNGALRDLKLRSLFADKIILNALNTAPSSATDTGTLGEVRITADYIYVCVATNTWKRTLIETW